MLFSSFLLFALFYRLSSLTLCPKREKKPNNSSRWFRTEPWKFLCIQKFLASMDSDAYSADLWNKSVAFVYVYSLTSSSSSSSFSFSSSAWRSVPGQTEIHDGWWTDISLVTHLLCPMWCMLLLKEWECLKLWIA